MYQSDEHPERCPNCTSDESTVPIVTVDGTTLWECTNDACSGARWRTETIHEGVRENPDPETVEKLLNGAAAYRDEETLQGIANDIARLYPNSRTTGDGSNAERVPCPR